MKTVDFPRIREGPKYLKDVVLEYKGWFKRDFISVPARSRWEHGYKQEEDC